MKFYFYKMTVDDGGAPCVEDNLLSLAICKPRLRKTAAVGDIVIGFAASSLCRDNRLIYMAKITRKLQNGSYYCSKKYTRRSDCIYKPVGSGYRFRKQRKYHQNQEDLEHDLGSPPKYDRAVVILSDQFCYWGSAGTTDYKKYNELAGAIAQLTQGHRVYHSDTLFQSLVDFVRDCHLKGPEKKGEPHQTPQSGQCRRRDSCVTGPSKPRAGCV